MVDVAYRPRRSSRHVHIPTLCVGAHPGEGIVHDRILKLVAGDGHVTVADFRVGAADCLLIAARGARVTDRGERKPTARVEDAVDIIARGRVGDWTPRIVQDGEQWNYRPFQSNEHNHAGQRHFFDPYLYPHYNARVSEAESGLANAGFAPGHITKPATPDLKLLNHYPWRWSYAPRPASLALGHRPLLLLLLLQPGSGRIS